MPDAPATPPSLKDLLFARGAAAEIPAEDRIYEFLIGSWDLDLSDHLPDGSIRKAKGEVHAEYVLEGSAVQDVWISPPAAERTPGQRLPGNRCGTTLRIYDRLTRSWRVIWNNPVTGIESRLVARAEQGRVVQEGKDDAGNLMRWTFADISAEGADWSGEISMDQGKTWVVQASFRLSRK